MGVQKWLSASLWRHLSMWPPPRFPPPFPALAKGHAEAEAHSRKSQCKAPGDASSTKMVNGLFPEPKGLLLGSRVKGQDTTIGLKLNKTLFRQPGQWQTPSLHPVSGRNPN